MTSRLAYLGSHLWGSFHDAEANLGLGQHNRGQTAVSPPRKNRQSREERPLDCCKTKSAGDNSVFTMLSRTWATIHTVEAVALFAALLKTRCNSAYVAEWSHILSV